MLLYEFIFQRYVIMSPQEPHPSQKKITVAQVNNVAISDYQVESGLQSLLEPYRDAKGKARLSQEQQYAARKHVIENLITRELLYQQGCKEGITASQEEVSRVLASSREEYGTEQQFNTKLAMSGLSIDEYNQQVQRDIIINKFAASVVEGKRKTVTTRDARQYYDAHPDEMTGDEVRRILHVRVALDRYAPKHEEQSARHLLQKAITDKGALEKQAAQTAAPPSGVVVEDLGFVARGQGQMHPLLETIAFGMEEGQLSRVIKTEEGLHVLLIKTILEEGKLRSFDLIEEELKKKIYEMRSVELLNARTEKLRKKASVTVLDRMADNKLEQEHQEK